MAPLNSANLTPAAKPDADGRLDHRQTLSARQDARCCPECKTPLENLRCGTCHTEYPTVDAIPVLLPKGPEFQRALQIAAAYDSIYRHNTHVWEKLGRDRKEFVDYFSALVGRFPGKRLLEIGCGEGLLLAALGHEEKHAIDISGEAIALARSRTKAQFSIALAEGLPYPSKYFDLIISVGVMEHFLDADKALREIHRVLKPGGHYVNLVHVRLTSWDRCLVKFRKLFFSSARPLGLLRRTTAKLAARPKDTKQAAVKQPIQNKYTTHSGQTCLEENGFKVIDVIHTRKSPALPLKGPFVVIYVGQK